MRVLVACEFSGAVRRAFVELGHAVTSVDLLPATDGANYHTTGSSLGFHYQGDVFSFLAWRGVDQFDLMIAHPPCTDLCVSGARWFKDKQQEQAAAAEFFMELVNTPVPMIAVENPIGIMSTRYRKPDQIIQPWQYGHGETKATCLWLKNLPKLTPTNIVEGRDARIHKMPPSKDRGLLRSITYRGIAAAMADQWGNLATQVSA